MIATKKRFMYNSAVNGVMIPMYFCEYVGLSTDAKPTTGVLEGSTFLEEDTSKVFIMKADSSWAEL